MARSTASARNGLTTMVRCFMPALSAHRPTINARRAKVRYGVDAKSFPSPEREGLMNRHKCTIVIVLALLLAAWAWTGKTPADGGPAVEAQSPATLKQKVMHDRQMKGLAVC